MKLALALLALLTQALVYFLMIAFSVPGTDSGQRLERFLTVSIYVMLGLCFVGAAMMIWAYTHNAPRAYLWALLPLPFAVSFVVLRWTVKW